MSEPTAGEGPRAASPQSQPPSEPVKVLYIGGCGRSGSTLLDRILGQIPGMWSVGEIVHIWRRGVVGNQLCGCGVPFRQCPFWSRVGAEAFGGWDALKTDALLNLQRRVDRNRYIPQMVAPWAFPAYREALGRYTDYLARLYLAVQQVSGAEMIVDSTKHASYAFLLRQVPGIDLHVLHLARDARGVAYSWTKEIRKPEVEDVTEYMPRYRPGRMGLRWVSYNSLFHALRWTRTPSLFLRYESLVQHPRDEVTRILTFAGREQRPEDLQFIGEGVVDLGPTHTVAGNPMRFSQGELTLRIDEEWRELMDPKHQTVVGALTWPLMRLYGYKLRERT